MAPAGFVNCVRKGGRVRRIVGPNKQFNVGKGEYRNVCWLDNKPHWGHKHKKKEQ